MLTKAPKTVASVSIACALTLLSPAAGDFVGIAALIDAGTTTTGEDLTVYRLYATFDSPNDQCNAIGGVPFSPMTFDTAGSGMFQHTLLAAHRELPVIAEALVVVPDMTFDSYLTIGVPGGYVGTPTLANLSFFNVDDFNPGVPLTGYGAPVVTVENGGWDLIPSFPETAVKPFPPPSALPPAGDGAWQCQQTPGGDWGVLIGQFVLTAGAPLSGTIGIMSVFEDGVPRLIEEPMPFSFGDLCDADVDGDLGVGFADLLDVIAAWGPCAECPQDANEDGAVNFADVLFIIANWGPCCAP